MFAVVKIERTDNTLLPVFGRKRILCRRIDIDSEKYFFIITVRTRDGEIPYKKVNAFARNLKNSLYYTDEENEVNEELSGHRLLNNSIAYLKNSPQSPFETSLCLYDRKGIFCHSAERLVPLASRLHIICPEKGRYLDFQQTVLRRYGLSVSVSQKWNSTAALSNTVITDDSEILPLSYKGRVFSLERRIIPGAVFVIGQGIILPYVYDRLCPDGLDKEVFASALYERCGIGEMTVCPYEKTDCC